MNMNSQADVSKYYISLPNVYCSLSLFWYYRRWHKQNIPFEIIIVNVFDLFAEIYNLIEVMFYQWAEKHSHFVFHFIESCSTSENSTFDLYMIWREMEFKKWEKNYSRRYIWFVWLFVSVVNLWVLVVRCGSMFASHSLHRFLVLNMNTSTCIKRM